MDDPFRVDHFQGFCDLLTKPKGVIHRRSDLVEECSQRITFHILHGGETLPFLFSDFMDVAHEGMSQVRG